MAELKLSILNIFVIPILESCKYPNLNMKFDIQKIVERMLGL